MIRILLLLFLLFPLQAFGQGFQCTSCLKAGDCDLDSIPTANDCDDTDPQIVTGTLLWDGTKYQTCANTGIGFALVDVPIADITRINCSGGESPSGAGTIANPYKSSDCVDDQFLSCVGGAKPSPGDVVIIGEGCGQFDYSGSAPTGLNGQAGDPVCFYGDPQTSGPDIVGNAFEFRGGSFSNYIKIQNLEATGGDNYGISVGSGGSVGIEILANYIHDYARVDNGSNRSLLNLHSTIGSKVRHNKFINYDAITGNANPNINPVLFFEVVDLDFSYNEVANPVEATNPATTDIPNIKFKHAASGGCPDTVPQDQDTTCIEEEGGGVVSWNYIHDGVKGLASGEQNLEIHNNLFKNQRVSNIELKNQGGFTYIENIDVYSNTIIDGDCLNTGFETVYFGNGDSTGVGGTGIKEYQPLIFRQNVCFPDDVYGPSSGGAVTIDNAGPDSLIPIIGATFGSGSTQSSMSDNCYFTNTGSIQFSWFGADQSATDDQDGAIYNFTQWQAADASVSRPAIDQGSLVQDPNLDSCERTTAATTSDCANTLQAGYLIVQDSKTVELVVTDPVMREDSDSGSITINLVGGIAPAGGLEVYLNTGGPANNGTDYTIGNPTIGSGTLLDPIIIPAGDSTLLVPINIVDDSNPEATESLTLSLAGTNDAACTASTTQFSGSLLITDDDTVVTTTTLPTNNNPLHHGRGFLYRFGCSLFGGNC